MPRKVLLLAVTAATLLAPAGLSACGKSDSAASGSKSTTTAAASSGTTEGADEDPGITDPCALYPTAEMAKQMGADDVTAESSTAVSPTCTYSSSAHYLTAELAVLNEEQLASTPRDPTAYLTEADKDSVKVLDVSGIGDEVFGSTSKGGVSLVVRTGKTGYSVLLTNAGGGADAGSWADESAMVESAKSILTAVVDK